MKIGKQIIVPVLIILILGLYLGINKTGKMNYKFPAFDSVDSKSINSITIKGPTELIELTLEEETWRMGPENLRAEPSKISEMILFLVNPELIDVVSDTGNYQNYGLEEKDYISVKAWTNKNKILARELLIGNTNTTGNFTFIRLPGIERVFTVSGNRKDQFIINKNELLDKRILNINIPDIDKIMLSFTNSSYLLEKSVGNNNEDIWSYSDGSTIEKNNLEQNIRYLSNSRFNTYIDYKHIVSSEILFKIDIFGENLNESFTILEQKDAGYVCDSSFTDKNFILSENTGTQLIKMFKELF